MKTLDTVRELEYNLNKIRILEKQVGFVPTMGALHNGHLSLVEMALEKTPVVVISIFVNPAQFNDQADLNHYPKNIKKDIALLQPLLRENDLVFIPGVQEIYPKPDTRIFDFKSLDKVMEGVYRPGHFNGVAQIVSKLFSLVQPDIAFFGEKDLQQLIIIKKLTEKLQLPVKIVGCPIVREPDGLAMSSRNQLLGKNERAEASGIYRALSEAVKKTETFSPDEIKRQVIQEIEKYPTLTVEYFEIVNKEDLLPVKRWDTAQNIYGCIAVKAGKIRLIDNIKFPSKQGDENRNLHLFKE